VVSGALEILESSPPKLLSLTPVILSFGIIRFEGVLSYVDYAAYLDPKLNKVSPLSRSY
jgi:hypothetical protein